MLSHCWFSYYKHFRPCPSQRHKKIRGEVGGKKVDFTLQDIGSLSYNVNTVRTLYIPFCKGGINDYISLNHILSCLVSERFGTLADCWHSEILGLIRRLHTAFHLSSTF